MFHVMFYIKRLLVAAVLVITLRPVFVFAMHDPASDDAQLNFKQAIDVCDFEKAKSCLLQGANPNMNYDAGYNLLEQYAGGGTAQQVEFLLEHGADPFHYDYFGHSALCQSIFNTVPGQAEKIIPLLVKRVGVNYPISAQPKYTALHIAAQDQNVPLIELLLQLGADPNCESSCFNEVWWQDTPLDRVLSLSPESWLKPTFFPAVKLLCQYGGATTRRKVLQDCLSPEQIAELMQIWGQILAYRDCDYLGCGYPYQSDGLSSEDQLTYKGLYNCELGKYLPLSELLVEECSDYSGNALPGALLDLLQLW